MKLSKLINKLTELQDHNETLITMDTIQHFFDNDNDCPCVSIEDPNSFDASHVGTICEHHQDILDDGDAYCVECSDGVGDVCEGCFGGYECIKNVDSSIFENPYNNHGLDYWFNGTVAELKTELAKQS
jgi:hypothetical protein